MGLFDHIPRIKTVAFDYLDSSCYDNEKRVYGRMLNEVYNNYGTRCFYYIVDYNTSRDVIFGEDGDRHILRRFPLQAYFTLPQEEDLVSLFGIEEMDNFDMFISKMQLSAASTLDYNDQFGETSGTFPMYSPMEGDLIRPAYNDQIYEILHVHDTEEQFHQDHHTWKITVRKYKDLHFTVDSTNTSALSEMISAVDQGDLFNIGAFIDTIKEPVIVSGTDNDVSYSILDTSAVSTSSYTTSSDGVSAQIVPNITPSDDPFGGW